MRDKQSKKVVIIHDIDSDNIEKAILILRNGGREAPVPSGYHIVNEAQEIIHAYRKTMEKTQHELCRKEKKIRHSQNGTLGFWRTLCVLSVMAGSCAFGYFMLRVVPSLLEKF